MPAVVPAIEGIRQFIRDRLRSEKVECKTAIIRQLLPDIETATNAGFTYVQVARWLGAQGFAYQAAPVGDRLQLRQKKGRREKPNAQQTCSRLKADTAAEAGKRFKHDPVADAKKCVMSKTQNGVGAALACS
jgi:hypothetical protein